MRGGRSHHRHMDDRKRAGARRVIRGKLHRDRAAGLGADDVSGVRRPPCRGHAPRRLARLGSDHSKPAGIRDLPNPGRSGRSTRNSCPMRGIHAYQTRLDFSLPWIRTTVSGLRQGSPNQSSRKKKSSADGLPEASRPLRHRPHRAERTGRRQSRTPSAAAVPQPRCSISRREPVTAMAFLLRRYSGQTGNQEWASRSIVD